jgi:hypothetical protein
MTRDEQRFALIQAALTGLVGDAPSGLNTEQIIIAASQAIALADQTLRTIELIPLAPPEQHLEKGYENA